MLPSRGQLRPQSAQRRSPALPMSASARMGEASPMPALSKPFDESAPAVIVLPFEDSVVNRRPRVARPAPKLRLGSEKTAQQTPHERF